MHTIITSYLAACQGLISIAWAKPLSYLGFSPGVATPLLRYRNVGQNFKGTLKLNVNHSKSLEVKGQSKIYKSRLTAIADRLTARVKKKTEEVVWKYCNSTTSRDGSHVTSKYSATQWV